MRNLILILILIVTPAAAQVEKVSLTSSVGIGIPNQAPTGIFNRTVNLTVNNRYTVGYGNNRIFGNYGHVGVSHKGYYVGWTNYHNDWGHWITVKKTITLYDRKKRKARKKQ